MLGPLTSMLLVFALLAAVLIWLRRLNRAAAAGRRLRVVESVPLGGGKSLALVQVEKRRFVLAAAPQGVCLLCELGPEEPSGTDSPEQAASGRKLLWAGVKGRFA